MTDWKQLSSRNWVRKRWRSDKESDNHCSVCDAPFNRPDTYYVRPAYTDGEVWMCASCFDEMNEAIGQGLDHRYGRRP